ncbi:MAG: hypothetical protein IJU79_02320 [Desulfovibrionaceae bacterium]|nr:hypothetical protein [Desulfovibrionaceae bacterium]
MDTNDEWADFQDPDVILDARDLYLRCLADVLQTSSGVYVLHDILRRLGVCQMVPNDSESVELFNFGERLLDDIGQASPKQCLNLIARLRDLQV